MGFVRPEVPPLSIWTEPSPSDWDRWEDRLRAGEPPAAAARAVRDDLTCSAFRRSDPVRQKAALEMGQEARGLVVDKRVEGWALADDASDAMRLAWAKRWQPEYAATTQRVEVDHGPIEITVTHERRLTLADVAAFARTLPGLGDSPRGQLPAAGEVLATFDGSESAAGGVPARPEP